jgi:hypothetical protein
LLRWDYLPDGRPGFFGRVLRFLSSDRFNVFCLPVLGFVFAFVYFGHSLSDVHYDLFLYFALLAVCVFFATRFVFFVLFFVLLYFWLACVVFFFLRFLGVL